MAEYVKFRRGNPTAFQAILDANKAELDTLYFIYEEDEAVGKLYLGSKLIAGDADVIGATSLKDLSDVKLGDFSETDCLIYDINLSRWVNKPIADILPIFVGTNGEAPAVAGLVPATTGTNKNLFLRSDGQWTEVVVASEALVLQTVVGSEETHDAAIARIVGENKLNKGDIVVVKDLIANDLYEYTSYTYNGEEWIAMDGNYNAESVYFDEDFIFTKAIGTVSIPASGSTTVAAAGKNIKEFFAGLFAAEQNPSVTTKVSASMTLQSAKTVEAGTEYEPSYSISFNKGKYSYGPDTGITATYSVSDTNNNTATVASGKFAKFIVDDNTAYQIDATVSYTEGAIPVSNLGNPVESKRIPADTIDLSSDIVTGYRNAFYGTLTTKEELTSDIIRGLTKTNADVTAGTILSINIPVGAMRVVIAYEATVQNLTSVLDKNDSNANIVSGFGEPLTIQVEGANGHAAIDYKVYVMDFANPYDAANVYTATI